MAARRTLSGSQCQSAAGTARHSLQQMKFAVESIMQRNHILGAKVSGQKQTGHRSRPVGGVL
jgi:hypothetical protein